MKLFKSLWRRELPLLTATHLKKHLVAVSQISESELDVLATFMGHVLRIHRGIIQWLKWFKITGEGGYDLV